MSNWFILFGLAGVVNVLTRSYLLQPLRERVPFQKLRYMANCPQCTGIWVGFFYCLLCLFPCLLKPFSLFIWGGAVSLCADIFVTTLDVFAFGKSALLKYTTTQQGIVMPEMGENGDADE